jgi:hypothetical protein
MTREKQIRPAPDKLPNCHSRPSDKIVFVVTFGHVEGMMRHHDFGYIGAKRTKLLTEPGDLGLVDATTFDRQRPGGVDAEDSDLFIDIERMHVVGNVTPILVEWENEAEQDVVQRNVVIARDYDLGPRQLVKKSASRFELATARALRKIAGHRNDIGLDIFDGLNQRLDDSFVNTAEVDIGEMHERSHV